jgi:asparagine synthase (glutamine-hydrolysing)
LPLSLWFGGPLYQPSRDILLAADSRLRSFFKVDMVANLIEENKRGQADNGKRIWALLMLELWQRKYIG